MKIKIAEITDLDNLYELNKLFGNETTKEKIKELIKTNDREIICIIYEGYRAVGFCSGLIVRSVCYNSGRMDIESLYVREEFRRKGIGEALIKFIEKEAIAKDIHHFHIITDENNFKAIKLYKKTGFMDTGEILLDKTIGIDQAKHSPMKNPQ